MEAASKHSRPVAMVFGVVAVIAFVLHGVGLANDAAWPISPLSPLSPLASPPESAPPILSPGQDEVEPIRVTATPTRTPRPTRGPAPTVPPPPGWPEEEPWPPTSQAQVTHLTPELHPTPIYPEVSGERPAGMEIVWYAHQAEDHMYASQEVRGAWVDDQGRRWEETQPGELAIDLGRNGGRWIAGLYASPDGRWLAVQTAFCGAPLVDTGSRQVAGSVAKGGCGAGEWFYGWHPDSSRALVSVWEGMELVDIRSGHAEAIPYPAVKGHEYASLLALAYSPDGNRLADLTAYPVVCGLRDSQQVELGVTSGGQRTVLAEIPGGSATVRDSLIWSPDGERLAWVACIEHADYPVVPFQTRTELWVADVADAKGRMVAVLGEGVDHLGGVEWSADGRQIAAVVLEGDKRSASGIEGGIWIFDVASGERRPVAQFPGHRLSDLTWSPDGRWLAVSVCMGDYGEIWVVKVDGSDRHPIAGPALAKGPVVWLPAPTGSP
jgi:hypothetical protein